MEKKKIISISIILSSVLLLIGTLAWFTWKSKETGLVLTVGDINNIQVIVKPYQIDSEVMPVLTYEGEEYVNVEANNNSSKSKNIKLLYRINNIDNELINENFRYTITKSVDGGNTFEEYLSGNFLEANTNQDFYIMEESIPANSVYKYRVYVWLDGTNTGQGNIQGKNFKGELRAEFNSTNNIIVDVPDGLIPITYDTSSSNTIVKTISKDDDNWYNYDNKIWANGVLVKESGTNTREYYQNNIGVEIPEEDILAYYVYIPRYKYKIWTTELSATGKEQEIEITFENKYVKKSTGSSVGEYLTHPAFTFGTDELNGIWFGKFETTGTINNPTIKPNIISLRGYAISENFTAIKKIEIGYGLGGNVDSHMSKNSEWGAAAYLSHSKYGRCTSGTCEEIRRNNNSAYYTGYSAVKVATTGWSETSSSINQFGTSNDITQPYNTKIGYLASTTGNIYGIYDMSGGAWEMTMGVLSDSLGNPRSGNTSADNSGYNGMLADGSMYTSGLDFPDSKYYDIYTSANVLSDEINLTLTACNDGVCFGHGLSETNGWNNDAAIFASAAYPWITRGGMFEDGVNAGLFYFRYATGEGGGALSSRAVLSVLR